MISQIFCIPSQGNHNLLTLAKFRTNHQRGGGKGASYSIRLVIFFIMFVAGLLWIYKYIAKDKTEPKYIPNYSIPAGATGDNRYYLPIPCKGQLVHHSQFSLCYNEADEEASWVAYELTKKMLKLPNLPRKDRFEADTDINTRSANYGDYTGSGYTRGHLVPAADMSWNDTALTQTFLMSNITPQLSAFNGGIWRELEEDVRDWAFDDDRIFITSGPIFIDNQGSIGKQNKIRVPSHFFKAILDIEGNDKKSIGFVIPNAMSELPLQEYAVTIDSIEKLTGLDLYPELLTQELEDNIESKMSLNDWRFSQKRYELRTKYWNNN